MQKKYRSHSIRKSHCLKKLSDLKTPFGNVLLKSFKKRIQERRNVGVVHLLKYLKSTDFLEQSYDEIGTKFEKIK